MNTINNVPVCCNICGGTAYGRESTTKVSYGHFLECLWICSCCGGVAKRHTEEIRDNHEQIKNNG